MIVLLHASGRYKRPSGTRAADRLFFNWIDLEPNTAVLFQRFGITIGQESNLDHTCGSLAPIKHTQVNICFYLFSFVHEEGGCNIQI